MKKTILILSLVFLVAAIVYLIVFAQTSGRKIVSVLVIIAMLYTASAMTKNMYGKRRKR